MIGHVRSSGLILAARLGSLSCGRVHFPTSLNSPLIRRGTSLQSCLLFAEKHHHTMKILVFLGCCLQPFFLKEGKAELLPKIFFIGLDITVPKEYSDLSKCFWTCISAPFLAEELCVRCKNLDNGGAINCFLFSV